jgi:hypothetical protein
MYLEYDHFALYLSSEDEEVKHAKYTFSILNSKSEETHILTFEQKRTFSTGWGNDLISKTELKNHTAELLPGNALTIVLRVKIL